MSEGTWNFSLAVISVDDTAHDQGAAIISRLSERVTVAGGEGSVWTVEVASFESQDDALQALQRDLRAADENWEAILGIGAAGPTND
jgi:hypothetical protein